MAKTKCILLMLVVAMAFHQAIAPPPKNYVHIQNQLPGNMGVHCSGQGADLGAQNLQVGKEYAFSFYLDNFGNAAYSCKFDWAGHSAQFIVFSASGGNVGPCAHCLWAVKVDGFYRAEDGQIPRGPVFRWS